MKIKIQKWSSHHWETMYSTNVVTKANELGFQLHEMKFAVEKVKIWYLASAPKVQTPALGKTGMKFVDLRFGQK